MELITISEIQHWHLKSKAKR